MTTLICIFVILLGLLLVLLSNTGFKEAVLKKVIYASMLELGEGIKQNDRKSLTNILLRQGVPAEMIALWAEAIRNYGCDTRKWPSEYHPRELEFEIDKPYINKPFQR